MKPKGKTTIIIIIALAAFAAGYFIAVSKAPVSTASNTAETTPKKKQIWFCSMHPQIQKDGPGLCPICNMELVPMDSSTAEVSSGEISFSENAIKLMELETTAVDRRAVEAAISLTGKVDYDQTAISYITAWTSGRINRLFVDFVGTRVIQGDHMVELYSPELNTARQEYLQAYKLKQNYTDKTSAIPVDATLSAARDKLKLLGVSEAEIDKLSQKQTISDLITINAPDSGIVIEKHLNKGAYVKPGNLIYTIADLNKLWVLLDAYESDLKWIRYGQKVQFIVAANSNETFTGIVSFIAPVVDPKTRTVKVRLNVNNTDHRLKPDMFVKATVKSEVISDGMVMDENMVGKWICPMHPSVIKDTAGTCDICQMPLVTTESLGYSSPAKQTELPLVIPATAPLITGKRAVVYIKVPDKDKPTFAGREVVLGPRVGNYYIVEKGLTDGDLVVTNGNFKIDSALQIQARPSMMSPDENDSTVSNQQNMNMNMDTAEQTICPVLGSPINKNVFIEYKGKKVYFCCPGCDKTFLADPEKYMDKLPQFGGKEK